MGSLTQDITRLCGEITTLRDSRQDLMGHMARQTREMKGTVAGMRAGFRKAHGQMANRTRAEQAKFVSDMRADVSGMLSGFDKAHKDMAAKTKGALGKFVSHMENEVSDMLGGFHRNPRRDGDEDKKVQRQICVGHGRWCCPKAERISQFKICDEQEHKSGEEGVHLEP